MVACVQGVVRLWGLVSIAYYVRDSSTVSLACMQGVSYIALLLGSDISL